MPLSKATSKRTNMTFSAEEIIIAEEHFFIPDASTEQKADFRLIVGDKSDDTIDIFQVPQNPAESILSGTVLHPSYADQGKARLAFHKARREFELAETVEERIRIYKHLYALAEAHSWAQQRVLQLIHEACHKDTRNALNKDLIHLFKHTFSKWIANDNCDLVLIAKSLLLLLNTKFDYNKLNLLETTKRLHHKAPLESHFTQISLSKYLKEVFTYFLNSNYKSPALANYWMEHALKRLMEDHTPELRHQIINMIFSDQNPTDFFISFLNQLGKQSFFDTSIDFLMIEIREKCLNETAPNHSILALVGYYELYCYANNKFIKSDTKKALVTQAFKDASWKIQAIPNELDPNTEQSTSIEIKIKNLNLPTNIDYLNELDKRLKSNRFFYKTGGNLHAKCCKAVFKLIYKRKEITLNHFELIGQSTIALAKKR